MANIYYQLCILIASILAIIYMTTKLKMHAAMALLIIALLAGLALDIPGEQVIVTLSSGFGSMLGNIGIIIILGCLLGNLLEKTKALATITYGLVQFVGRKKPLTTLSILGIIVGIPVFCDSAYIILSGLSKRIANQSATSSVSGAVVMSSSLYVAHNLIPPTPGPLAAAGNLGIADNLGLVIILGTLISIPVMLTGVFFAKWIGKKVVIKEQDLLIEEIPEANLFKTALPLALPITLIGIGTVSHFIEIPLIVKNLLLFLGNPVVALLIGLATGVLFNFRKETVKMSHILEEGVMQAGPILIITGMGGAFGNIIKESGLTSTLIELIPETGKSGVLILIIAFCLSALIKTAQGSSTSAIVIVSALFSTLAGGAYFSSPFTISCLVLAIGAGAMLVSHANDSYFWIVSRFSNLSMKQTLKTFTVATILQGATALVFIILMYVIANNFV